MTALDAPPAPTSPAPRSRRAASVRVVRQLAAVEARRLLLHPIVWAGIALAGVMAWADLGQIRFVLPRESIYLQNLALPIGAATLLAVHLATTRPRRDDVVEVFEPAVHGDDARIRALLLASLAPAALTALLVAGALAAMAALGAPGPVWWAEAATGPALVAALGMLGVLLGRVAPWRLTPLFALVAVFLVQFLLPEAGGPMGASSRDYFAPLAMPGWLLPDPATLLRPATAHLAYLVGIAATLAVAAMLATRVTIGRVVAGVVAVALAVAGAVAQTAPPAVAEVDALLAGANTPVQAGTCAADGTGAEVCALPTLLDWRDDWAALVHDVRQPLLDHGVDPGELTVAQRIDPSQASFELSRWYPAADVEDRLAPAWDAEYADTPGTVLVTSDWPRASGGADRAALGLATHVARQATGLRSSFDYVVEDAVDPIAGPRACSAAGQARAAVSLWLAAQSSTGVEAALREATAMAEQSGMVAIDLWTRSVAGSEPDWSRADAEVALQLLEQPRDAVAADLAADWSRWTDPGTALSDLVDAFGLAAPSADAGSVTPTPPPNLDANGVVVYADEAAFEAATDIGCP